MRLKLVPDETAINFLGSWRITFSTSMVLVVLSLVAFFSIGLNFGIDFRGGTSIRTEATQPVDIGAYRAAIVPLGVGDVAISEVFDPTYGPDRNVAMVRIQTQDGGESISPEMLAEVEQALRSHDPTLQFTSVESVGPKVSGELVQSAILAVVAALAAVLFYIWLRFEWQFALGAVAALVHDIVLTIGLFSVLQIRFDLAIIAALLTIVGYSLNDTVVVFDRMRENLIKYKKREIMDVMNLSLNETLSRTVVTSLTTLLALGSLFVLGGDVIRGFVFAMIWGVIVGTYSSVFVASAVLLWLGVARDPGNGRFQYQLGRVLLALGDLDGAEARLEAAMAAISSGGSMAKAGIVEPGLTASAALMKRSMASCVLGRAPAPIVGREPRRERSGPTAPWAPVPAMLWQAPQPPHR